MAVFPMNFQSLCCILCLLGCDCLRSMSPVCNARDKMIQQGNSYKKMGKFMNLLPHVSSILTKHDPTKTKTKRLMEEFDDIVPSKCAKMIFNDNGVQWSALQRCVQQSQGISPGCAACGMNYLKSVVFDCTSICAPLMATALSNTKNFVPCLYCAKPKIAQLSACSHHKNHKLQAIFTSMLNAAKTGNDMIHAFAMQVP